MCLWQGVLSSSGRVDATRQLEELRVALEPLSAEITRELGGTFSGDDDRLAVRQILALVEVAAIAHFGNPGVDVVVLEWVVAAFSILFGLEFAVWAHMRGWKNTLWDAQQPDLQSCWRLGAVVILTSLVGTLFLLSHQAHSLVSAQAACTLSGLTVLLVISSNRTFGKMVLAFGRASSNVVPTVIAICMFVLLYTVASLELFASKAVDPNTNVPFFDTLSRSLSTMFRMVICVLIAHRDPAANRLCCSSQETGMTRCSLQLKPPLRLHKSGSQSTCLSFLSFAVSSLSE